MSIGISISKIEFYIYDVVSGDEITNGDGSAKTFVLKDGEAKDAFDNVIQEECNELDLDMLEEIKDGEY